MSWSSVQSVGCTIIAAVALSAIGCTSEEDSGVSGFKRVTTDLTMAGSGLGTVLRTDPSPESCVKDSAVEKNCSWSFSDAGGGGSFVLEAEPSAGSVFGGWSACSSTSGVSGVACVLEFGSGASDTTFSPRATFTLEDALENSCPDIVVPPLGSLGLKTGPRPANATPVPDNPAAWVGTNYLTDPGFEQELAFQGGIPTGTGYWAFDQAWSAPSGQQGITAHAGSRMLHFVSSSRDGTQTDVGTASEQIQLVDVSALRTRIDAGQVAVQARAFFNRVAAGGCARIDNAFGIRVSAHAGIPTDVNVDLGFVQDNVTADDDPGTWQPGLVLLTLPMGTTHVAVRLFINEGAANNDPVYPEFHGHYADGATLVVQELL